MSEDQQVVECRRYKPHYPELGLSEQPQADRIVQISDLGEDMCRIFLTAIEQGYIGLMQLGGCLANVRGASRITNTILLHDQGLTLPSHPITRREGFFRGNN